MPNHWRFWQLVAAVALGLLATMGIGAQDLRPVPVLSASVIDQTGTLTRTQTSALEVKLAAFEREAGAQIAVLIVSTTQPEDIATYAQRVGEAWKIGRLINNRLIKNLLHSQRRGTALGIERFRAELELVWQRSQQSAQNKELS